MAALWTPHPVFRVPTREQAQALVAMHGPDEARRQLEDIRQKREELIAIEKTDPLRVPHVYEPEPFKKARALLADLDELAILGQNRSGKTVFTQKYVMEDLVYNENRAWAYFHQTAETSIRQQQEIAHRFIPREWRNLGRQGDRVYVQFSEATGFSNAKFIFPNGSRGYFFNYKQDISILEGDELDGVLFDELVPLPFLETVRFRRGRGRRLKVLVSFTPKTGYTATVGSLIEGGEITETLPAALLQPDVVHVKGCPPGAMPYVMQCRRKTAKVMWFHWGTNPYGANAEIRAAVGGENSAKIKMRCYGWVDRIAGNAFPRYCKAHKITRAQFNEVAKRGGTRYVYSDPGFDKNWFIAWIFVTPAGHRIVYREWPDAPNYDEWAVSPSEATEADGARKWDWRPGPAQRTDAGGSINRYKRMIMELEGQVWLQSERRWDASKAEPIQRRLLDPRLGGEKVPNLDEGTSIIDLLATESTDADGCQLPPQYWEEASACGVGEGIQLINLALAFDDSKPVTMENCPKLYIVDDLAQLDLALSSYVAPPQTSERNALKDPIDCLRYAHKDDFGHVDGELWKARRSTYY
jgi:hypothetical protein